MDPSGNGTEIDMNNLENCPDYQMSQGTFTKEMFLQACIISGCDYHSGIPGVGFKTALVHVKSNKGDLKGLCEDLHCLGKLANPKEYIEDGYKKALLTFKHQIVFDLKERREKYLTEPDGQSDLSFLGKIKPDHMAIQTAYGEVNPMTNERYDYKLDRFQLPSGQNSRASTIINSYEGYQAGCSN